MPAATPKIEAVKLWRFDKAFVLCITDSGTMGASWNSRSVGMMAEAGRRLEDGPDGFVSGEEEEEDRERERVAGLVVMT